VIGGGLERGGTEDGGVDHLGYPGEHGGGYAGAESAVEQTLSRLRALDARGPAPEAPTTAAEPRTLADLYRDHRMRMVRLAVLLVDDPSTAEDVVQEAFTGLHRHWAGLRDEAAAVAYLRTAVVNGSRSVLRRRRTARDYVPPHQVNARSAESLAMLSAEHQAVVDALGMLPPRQREVLVLRYYGGMSEAEIADATGISRGTVKSTASRALDAVQRAMAGRPGRS
jgi:RNA polymerase sigma-70 factor (sigma-E family)